MVRQLEFHEGGIPIANEGVYVCEESPPCCTPCSSCLDGLTPRYWQITISGLVDANPTDCQACNRYDATYTLRRANSVAGEDGIGGICPFGSNSADRCCWVCYLNTNQYECNSTAPNVIGLAVTTVASVKKIMVCLQSGAGEVVWEKTYPGSIDCRNISGDVLNYSTTNGTPQCDGSSATITITSVESISNPCCRGLCYPDDTPGPITVVVAGLSNLGGGCTDCGSLNGTYVLSRKAIAFYGDEVYGCWVGSFPEACGMDRIYVSPGPGEVRFYKSGENPFITSIVFNTNHYFPFSSYFTAPFADCAQYNGMEFRTLGDGYCDVPGSPGYATATISF